MLSLIISGCWFTCWTFPVWVPRLVATARHFNWSCMYHALLDHRPVLSSTYIRRQILTIELSGFDLVISVCRYAVNLLRQRLFTWLWPLLGYFVLQLKEFFFFKMYSSGRRSWNQIYSPQVQHVLQNGQIHSFVYRPIVFPVQAEYSNFYTDLRRRIFLRISSESVGNKNWIMPTLRQIICPIMTLIAWK